MDFKAFVNDIEKNQWKVHGVEVYEKGCLVHSWGDTRETKFPIYSATKTITSIAVGLAHDEGKIDLEKSVLEYLPTEHAAKMSAAQKETFGEITLERLLTMSVANAVDVRKGIFTGHPIWNCRCMI